ncbi:reversion-inducing cysteine-rich protein with Kazal motifs-like [Paramacrobiotus metropolitanus]|uniref:reversion-inducing cysteine-rich protein with Kazal motifs-like n=1 Tax=Paramacrobiotus metropolitanus TaxID=2943436 RepID=UPI002445A966|nr:reversion-inducing cysteine-rich protein with Kazal motifs-like [Paramacrobiotus metropolitanus]
MCHPAAVLFTFVVLVGLIPYCRSADGLHLPCCEAVNDVCRSACHQITLLDLATKPQRHKLFTAHLEHHCRTERYVDHFMTCFNNTTRELQRGQSWSGRECCTFAKDPRCRVACVYAQSLHELEHICFINKETPLYECIRLRKDALRCCNSAGGRKAATCRKFCSTILPVAKEPPQFTYSDLLLLHSECSTSLETVHCAWNLGKAPFVHLDCAPCCNASTNSQCLITCQRVARNFEAGIDAIENLVSGGCGRPDPEESFWTCLMEMLDISKSVTFIVPHRPPPPEAMKLQCCLSAVGFQCRRACFQAYGPSGSLDNIDWFMMRCKDDSVEVALRTCLRDVTVPCQMGCSNLNYCSYFNDRPTLSFRSCNGLSDREAQFTADVWKRDGHIRLNNSTIKIKFDRRCGKIWRGLLCAIHIKPCNTRIWGLPLCFSKCKELVQSCIDPQWETTAEAVCNHFLPIEDRLQNPAPFCLNIEIPENSPKAPQFISVDAIPETPCNPNPCSPAMRCDIRRYNERVDDTLFTCRKGCVVSSSGFSYVIAEDDIFITPNLNDIGEVCYTVCTCMEDGSLGHCVDLPDCEKVVGCHIGAAYYEHGTKFQKACSRCICIFGETVCTAGYCITESQRDEERNSLTGLPCSCPINFNRVCGSNGKTYPTECSARCSGLSEYDFIGGYCALNHACPKTDCGPDKWCIEQPEVCLQHHISCHQHVCVDIKSNCSEQPTEIACDTDGHEHFNLCSLLLEGRHFAYLGRCLQHCKTTGSVCGHNSETFPSECSALAVRVGVDYPGTCSTVGGRIERGFVNTCEVVYNRCPKPVRANCTGLVPPDACCPICAGGLRVLFSPRRVKRLTEKGHVPLTTRRIMGELQKLIQSSNCEVLGYYTMENDIAIMVKRLNLTDEHELSDESLNLCVIEAERLHYLIERQHPLITMNAYLWPLAASKIIHTSWKPFTSIGIRPLASKTLAFLVVLFSCLWSTAFLVAPLHLGMR